MRSRDPVLLGLLALACFACPAGGQKKGISSGPQEGFECSSRRAEYMVTGGFVADEAGVSVVCDGEAPRLIKWRLEDGERKTTTHPLTVEQFERTWERVDNSGWRYFEQECENPGAGEADPIYVIDIADHALARSSTCQGKELPHPYDKLVNEIDLLAAAVE